jgi:hypothetical protein
MIEDLDFESDFFFLFNLSELVKYFFSFEPDSSARTYVGL